MIATQKQILASLTAPLKALSDNEYTQDFGRKLFDEENVKGTANRLLTCWIHKVYPAGEYSAEFSHALSSLANGENLKLHSRIVAKHLTALEESVYSDLQVPFEPIYGNEVTIALMALATGKTTEFWPHYNEGSLLTQVFNATLPNIDVLLAFELAGLPAPRAWEVWRKPDETSMPSKGTCAAHPGWGNFTVHWHNGEKALITTPTGAAEVIRVELIENANVSVLDRLVRNNVKAAPKAGKPKTTDSELNENQVAALAAKWANV